jgi:hypothetical protein
LMVKEGNCSSAPIDSTRRMGPGVRRDDEQWMPRLRVWSRGHDKRDHRTFSATYLCRHHPRKRVIQ